MHLTCGCPTCIFFFVFLETVVLLLNLLRKLPPCCTTVQWGRNLHNGSCCTSWEGRRCTKVMAGWILIFLSLCWGFGPTLQLPVVRVSLPCLQNIFRRESPNPAIAVTFCSQLWPGVRSFVLWYRHQYCDLKCPTGENAPSVSQRALFKKKHKHTHCSAQLLQEQLPGKN